jgi:rubredoxin-NAD+ reductase
LSCERGIVTDRYCQTSDPDVYALGDCAEVNGHLLYYVAPLSICAQALASTLNGQAKEVVYGVMPVTIKTSQHPVMVQPPARGSQGAWQIDVDQIEGVAAKFVDDAGQTLGFALTGNQLDRKDHYVGLMKSA